MSNLNLVVELFNKCMCSFTDMRKTFVYLFDCHSRRIIVFGSIYSGIRHITDDTSNAVDAIIQCNNT